MQYTFFFSTSTFFLFSSTTHTVVFNKFFMVSSEEKEKVFPCRSCTAMIPQVSPRDPTPPTPLEVANSCQSVSTLRGSRMWNTIWTLVVIFSRSEEAPSTVWSLGTVSCPPWTAALGRNALARASMATIAQRHQTRCRVSWVHRASTRWWPFLWFHLRLNRP